MSCSICVSLVPLGGTGCGIEVDGGVAYSIGDQDVDASASDPCSCVDEIFINGSPPPYSAVDGEALGVTITLLPSCSDLVDLGASCPHPFRLKRMIKRRGKTLILNKNAILSKLRKFD